MPTTPRPKKPRNPATPKGWRVDPIPSRPAYQGDAGHILIPVWLTKNGQHMADTDMVLLPAEAKLLSERLTNALCGSRSPLQELIRGRAVADGPGVTVVAKHPHFS
ncbi:hypothetical protein [Streptomyces sp. NPDC002851]